MDYWRKHFNDNAKRFSRSIKRQVDMTQDGREVDDAQVNLRVDSILRNLKLIRTDVVLDLCCGNGMITRKISEFVSRVYAVDFSEKLIEVAKEINNSENISYSIGDASRVNFTEFPEVNKICIQSCLQYLSSNEVELLLHNLSALDSIKVYISNIPDIEKMWNYYNTDEKKAYYYRCEREGRPHLGTWWGKTEIECIAVKFGFQVEFIPINPGMNTSYYRFDLLLSK